MSIFADFSQPAIMQTTLHEAERLAFEDAKDMVLARAELATVDHRGKRLSERKWRDHMNFIGSL